MNIDDLKTNRLKNLCRNLCVFNDMLHFEEDKRHHYTGIRIHNDGEIARIPLFSAYDRSPRKRYVKILEDVLSNKHYAGDILPGFSCLEEYIIQLSIRGL